MARIKRHGGLYRIRRDYMAQEVKHSFNGRRKVSGGFKPGNMNKFIWSGTKRKRKKVVK